MVKIDWKQVLLRAGKGVFQLAVGGVLYNLSKCSNNPPRSYNYWSTANYSDAVEAIINDGMFSSSQKQEMIFALSKNGDSEYYKSVINIVHNNSMFTSSKISMIKYISK